MTPAINLVYVEGATGHVRRRTLTGDVTNTTIASINNPVFWLNESRPASVTVPPSPDGFRNMTNWFHTGRSVRKVQAETLVSTRAYPAPSLNYDSSYSDGSFWNYSPPSVNPNQAVRNKALTKALSNLRDQKFHAGIFFAEAPKSIRMIRDRLHKIESSVYHFRRTYPKLWRVVRATEIGGLRRHLWCKIPAAWLEVQYGWIPLMNDINGLLGELSYMRDNLIVQVKGRAKATDTYSHVVTGKGAGGWSSSANYRTITKSEVGLFYQLRSPPDVVRNRLGLVNPAEIVWEVVPYSFVVDWALPIGAWLNALTADYGYNFKGGYTSTLAKMKPTSTYLLSGTPGMDVPTSAVQLTGESYSFTRSIQTNPPVPGVYFKNPISLLHVMNGLALLARAFVR